MSTGTPSGARGRLAAFDARVDERVAAIRSVRPDWPCRRGCDLCCRRLARAPELTRAERERVDEAVQGLEPSVRADVEARVAALRARLVAREQGPVVCPYLDESEGACRIYEARPLACRTYGFFVDRDAPEVCEIIDRDLAARGERGIVWGNAASLAAEVRAGLGERLSFLDDREEGGPRTPSTCAAG